MHSGGVDDDPDDMISGINVTPLVDIVLVLLIIFMLLATRIVRDVIQQMQVDLPKAAHAGESTGSMLAVVLTQDGEIYLNGVLRTEDELRQEAHVAVAKDPTIRAIISADKSALHGMVVHLIDLVKGEGISKFAINIEKEE